MYGDNGPTGDGTVVQGGGNGGDWIGALIMAGADMYQGYQDRKVARENTNKTIAAQKEQAELAYQRSVEMWNKQNLYNSPEAQMERFKAAGLNPHLIYGKGETGNASGPPQYQPPNLQYRYQAPNYGSAIAGILPMLMQIGSWMSSMRAQEASTKKTEIETTRSQQLIDFLIERNPQVLKEGSNRLSLFPYQSAMAEHNMGKTYVELNNLQQEFRHRFGEDLFSSMTGTTKHPDQGGLRRLQFLEQATKNRIAGYNEQIAEAKASWTDLDITDPQAIMMMVMQAVMGMAGAQLRSSPKLSTHKGRRR